MSLLGNSCWWEYQLHLRTCGFLLQDQRTQRTWWLRTFRLLSPCLCIIFSGFQFVLVLYAGLILGIADIDFNFLWSPATFTMSWPLAFFRDFMLRKNLLAFWHLVFNSLLLIFTSCYVFLKSQLPLAATTHFHGLDNYCFLYISQIFDTLHFLSSGIGKLTCRPNPLWGLPVFVMPYL